MSLIIASDIDGIIAYNAIFGVFNANRCLEFFE